MGSRPAVRPSGVRTAGLAVLAGLVLAAPAVAQPSSRAGARPNVILVITDDQGYGDIAAHGNPVVRTPHLDRLHRESVRLTDFHVDPTCSPTRSALLTGRYSTRTGVWHTILGRSMMLPRERTLADLFARSGYRTGMVGKWHLGDNHPHRPHDRGFQEALYHGGGVVGQVGDEMDNDLYDDTYQRNGRPEHVKGYSTDAWFDEALAFVERSRAQPFFLYLATNAAHWPYYVDQRYVDPYLQAGVPPTMARFFGMVTNIDENLGRLRSRLAELGLAEDTIFIFMTDNGSAEGWSNWQKEPGSFAGFNAGMRAGKGSEYDGGHRVPFFIHWPGGGLVGGRDVPLLSAHIDVLPTLAELCGLDLSGWPALDGASLASVLRGAGTGTPASRRRAAPPPADPLAERVLVVHSQRVDVPIKWRQSAVMTERWRLVNGKELYDIEKDPGQASDVAAEHPAEVARLRAAYDGWWASLEPVFAETARISIGSEHEDPVALTSHDWRTDDDRQSVWNANQVNAGHQGNGWWALDVVRPGHYEVELRRWPRPSHLGADARTARLKVGEVEMEKVLSPYDASATFRVSLPAGPTSLQSWLTGRRGESRGAYFVYVKRVE